MYFFEDGVTVKEAIERLRPTIENIINEFSRRGVYIMVTAGNPKDVPFAKAVKFEISILDGEEYKKMAYAKTEESFRHKTSSGITAKFCPERVENGDTIWFGSIVVTSENDSNIIVVSVSGLKEYQDKAIADMIFLMIRMIAYEKIEKNKEAGKGIIGE